MIERLAAAKMLVICVLSPFAFGSAAVVRAATFDCVINPSMSLKIGSPVTTTLQTVDVDRGDRVVKGQVIARLESSVQAADVVVDEARAVDDADVVARGAKVEFAQAEVNRAEKLLETANVPRQKVEELRTNLRMAQGDLQIAKLNHQLMALNLARSRALVEQRIVRSPIDGVVVQRSLGPGEFVHQDTAIVALAAIDPLNVEAYPPVRYFNAIKPGMQAIVQPDAPANRAFDARVTIVDQVFDAASGTFGVRLALPNPTGVLAAGLRCKVTIDTEEKAADNDQKR